MIILLLIYFRCNRQINFSISIYEYNAHLSCHFRCWLDGAMWRTEDHEAHTQAAVCPVPHAGARLYLLLLREATSTRLGPEAS